MSLRAIWLGAALALAGCSQSEESWSPAANEFRQRLVRAGPEVSAARALDAPDLDFVCWIDEGEDLREPLAANGPGLGLVPDGHIGVLYRSGPGLRAVIIPRATLLAYQGTQCFDGHARWVRTGEGLWRLEGQRLP